MRLSIDITTDLNRKLKALAKQDMRTLMAYAAKALQSHVEREERKPKSERHPEREPS